MNIAQQINKQKSNQPEIAISERNTMQKQTKRYPIEDLKRKNKNSIYN